MLLPKKKIFKSDLTLLDYMKIVKAHEVIKERPHGGRQNVHVEINSKFLNADFQNDTLDCFNNDTK